MVPAVAVKVFVVVPAETDTDAGTVNNPLLLDSVTVAPPVGAACDNVTVHVDVPPVPKLVGLHESELTATAEGTVRLPPVALVVIAAPVPDAAVGLLTAIGIVPEAVADSVTFTVAIVPF